MSTKQNLSQNQLLLPEDYYYNEAGFMVFTEIYHQKRGYCCKCVCKHCPWKFKGKK